MSTTDPWLEPMRLALAEARAALDSDDVPVGAVVLSETGEVIGHGHNAVSYTHLTLPTKRIV